MEHAASNAMHVVRANVATRSDARVSSTAVGFPNAMVFVVTASSASFVWCRECNGLRKAGRLFAARVET